VRRAAATRWAALLIVAAVSFAAAFAIARAVGDGGGSASTPRRVDRMPVRSVSIGNLERAPTIKPLRSAAGTPPGQGRTTATSTTSTVP
jgi:hypothetical protein